MNDDRIRPPRPRRATSPLCEILRAQIGTLFLLVIVIAMLGDTQPPIRVLAQLA